MLPTGPYALSSNASDTLWAEHRDVENRSAMSVQ